MDAEQAAETDQEEVPATQTVTHSARRRVRRVGRPVLLVLLIPVVFALLLPFLMIGQEITAPSWITRRVEAQANAVLGGGNIAFESIHLTVERDLHPKIRMIHAVLTDAAGVPLARIPQIDVQLSPRGLVFEHEVLPQRIAVTGAEIALSRDAEGRLALSFNRAEQARPPLVLTPDALASVFEMPALEAVEEVRAEGLIVNYQDDRAGRSWILDGGSLVLERDRDGLSVEAEAALVAARSFVTTLALSVETALPSGETAVSLSVEDAWARDIATQAAGLSWLSVLDAPLSAAIRGELAGDGTFGDFNASLEIGAGALRPEGGAEGVAFQSAKAYVRGIPGSDLVTFDLVEVQSEWGRVAASGRALLRDMDGVVPGAILGQFRFSDMVVDPPNLYADPLTVSEVLADVKVTLRPFRVEIGSIDVALGPEEGERLSLSGEITARNGAWALALDASAAALSRERLLAFWPPGFRVGLRDWVVRNMTAASFHNFDAAVRLSSGAAPTVWISQEFSDTQVRFMRDMPPIQNGAGRITYEDDRFVVALDEGEVRPPQGGLIEAGGTVFTIPNTRERNAPAEVTLATESTITAALSLLDQPPFEFLTKAGREVSLADGRARVEGRVGFPIMPPPMPRGAVTFEIGAALQDVRSEALVPGRRLTASALTMEAVPDRLTVAGGVGIDGIPAEMVWSRPLGAGTNGRATLEGDIELSQRALDAFGVRLPPGMVGGEGRADVRLDFAPGAPPALSLTSTLAGVRMALPQLGWSKGAGAAGRMEIAATLGTAPSVDRLFLEAAGLRAEGAVSLEGGVLDQAVFTRLRVGDWFDAPVTLRGRGAGQPVGIALGGGTIDLQRANFGGGGGTGGEGGPLSVSLDRLRITDAIALTGFQGEFDAAGGLSGEFVAAMNGGARVSGTVVPQNGRLAIRLRSEDAGGVIRDAGLVPNAQGGRLELALAPTGGEGEFVGRLGITDLRIRDAPSLAALLNAISVVGLIQQLDGQGLGFDEVEVEFQLTPDRITVLRSSAVGPGLGISLDGFYTPRTRMMDFQGVVSPFYFINGIGSIFTRRGEGLVGFNFTLQGPVGSAAVAVNPLSALTPGMFREIFRRPPPEVGQ